MTTPVSPDSRPDSPHPSVPGDGSTPAFDKNVDPSGAWTKFFQAINPGQPVDPKEIKMFQEGLMKWFSAIIAQENRTWKEAYERMKRVSKE